MLEIIVCCVYDEEFYVYAHRYIEDSCYIVKECLFKYSRGYSCLLHTTETLKKNWRAPIEMLLLFLKTENTVGGTCEDSA